jgi:predicted RNA-binding Zn ribbon-like protein
MPADDSHTTGPFELSGGALCLDFANTWGNKADPESDRLLDYDRLVAFARQIGYLDEETAAALVRHAGQAAGAAGKAFALALELRGAIYRVFSARANGRDVSPGDVDRINSLVAETTARRRIERGEDGFHWSWNAVETNDLRSPIWPVVESAASLLTSDELARVCECNADDCSWLFLDRSRGASRRWCSMKSCGNRAKARRHYRKQQGE